MKRRAMQTWVRKSRESQGLPRHVEDDETLAQVIALMSARDRVRRRLFPRMPGRRTVRTRRAPDRRDQGRRTMTRPAGMRRLLPTFDAHLQIASADTRPRRRGRSTAGTRAVVIPGAGRDLQLDYRLWKLRRAGIIR